MAAKGRMTRRPEEVFLLRFVVIRVFPSSLARRPHDPLDPVPEE